MSKKKYTPKSHQKVIIKQPSYDVPQDAKFGWKEIAIIAVVALALIAIFA